jgi:hypothetical protein
MIGALDLFFEFVNNPRLSNARLAGQKNGTALTRDNLLPFGDAIVLILRPAQ